jgi:hypothetical protein
MDLDDDQLRAVYRHFPDSYFLDKMSDTCVVRQLEADLGL